jgi:predicted outer membrane repeat protein
MIKVFSYIFHEKRKILFLLSIFLITTLVISTISAVNAVDITISPSTSGGLKKAISDVGPGGTIHMENGVYTGNNNIGIRIDKSITIQGKGNNVVIDAKKKNRLFSVIGGADLTLKKVKLQNGHPNFLSDSTFSDRGGAVNINYGSVDFDNVVFYNNSASGDGGAVNIQSGDCSFVNCKFISNVANQGGAIYVIWNPASFTNCIFEKNGASSEGGAIAIMMDASVDFSNCAFNYNFAGEKGGAITSYGTGTLKKCTFNKNEVIQSKSYNAIHGSISRINCAITPKDGTKVSSNGNSNTSINKADLKITKILKKSNTHTVFIKNVGKKNAGKNVLGVYDGRKLIKKVNVKSIGTGKTVQVKVTLDEKYKNKIKTFKADMTNIVKESNKNNNIKKIK